MVADSAGEGMAEAANGEDAVEVAFGLVDDVVEDAAGWEAARAELDADDTASRPLWPRVCTMIWWRELTDGAEKRF